MFYPLKASTSQRIQRTRPGLWGREALCRFSSPRPGLHRFLTVHDDRVVLHRTAGGEKTNEVPVPGALLKAALPNLPNDQVRRGCCWCWWWVMLLDVGWCWLVLFLSGTCSRRWSGRRWKTLKPWSRQNHEKTWTKTLKHKKGVPNTVYCCHIKIPTMHWPHSSTLPVPGLLVVRMADHTTPPRPPPHFPSALAGRSAPGWIGACAAPVGLAVCPAPSTPWPWPGWLQPGRCLLTRLMPTRLKQSANKEPLICQSKGLSACMLGLKFTSKSQGFSSLSTRTSNPENEHDE